MLGRLKFNFDAAIDIMLDSIPTEMYESTTTTFCDPCMGGGQLVAAIEAKLREYGHDDENIASRVFGYEENQMRVRYARNKYKLISTLDTMSVEEGISMKFNVIIANPPYEGTKCLHQKFFNKSVEEMVIDGGIVCFLQPSTQYDNKKPRQKKAVTDMLKHIKEHTCNVTMVPGKVFEHAAIATKLSVTVLVKDNSNSGVIEHVKYITGDTHDNVSVKNINGLAIAPNIYESLFNKIFAKAQVGSLQDLIVDDGSLTFKLQKVRGHAGTDDFYTIISKSPDHQIMHNDYGLLINPVNIENVITYLKTNLARFALALYKFNGNSHQGELRIVPQVDFNQEWTDEKLMAEWGITEEEYAEILKVIPTYYD